MPASCSESVKPGWCGRLRRSTRIGIWFIAALVMLLLTIAVFALWCDTRVGHEFVERKITATKFDNGLAIRIGQIEGSIFGTMQVKEVEFCDPSGIFAAIPRMTIAWNPFQLIAGDLEIGEFSAESARLIRKPAFFKSNRANSALPFDRIEIERFAIERIELEPGVTGQRHRASASGSLVVMESGIYANIAMEASMGAGLAGGDKFDLTIRPAQSGLGFDLSGTMSAPADGLFAALTGKAVPIQLDFQSGSDTDLRDADPDWLGVDAMFDAVEADRLNAGP